MIGAKRTETFENNELKKYTDQSMRLEWLGMRLIWARGASCCCATAQSDGEIREGRCHLYFCLDGCMHAQGAGYQPACSLKIPSGCCAVIYHPPGFCHECNSPDGTRAASMGIASRNLADLIGKTPLGRVLQQAAKRQQPLEVVRTMTPAMIHTLKEMDDYTDYRHTGGLYVITRTMELLWLFVRNFENTSPDCSKNQDKQNVRKAQKILEQNLASPPSLCQLAAQVGMSLSKLKQVFPRVCGAPPYTHLRRVRMEHAMSLLRHTEMSVTHVALEVGYASPSRFSRAFAQHFGFNPSLAKEFAGGE